MSSRKHRNNEARTEHPITTVFRLILQCPFRFLGMAIIALGVFSLLPQATALITRTIFDRLERGDTNLRIYMILAAAILGIALGRAVAAFAHTLFDSSLSLITGIVQRKNILFHILRRPPGDALAFPPGESMNRMTKDCGYAPRFMRHALSFGGDTVFAVIAIVTMMRTSPRITIWVLLPLTVVLVVLRAFRTSLSRRYAAQRRIEGELSTFMEELFGSAPAIKVASAENRLLERFGRLNSERETLSLRASLSENLLWSISGGIVDIGTGLILIASAAALRSGGFTIGDFAIFSFYLNYLDTAVATLGYAASLYRQLEVGLKRMHAMMKGAPKNALARRYRFRPRKSAQREAERTSPLPGLETLRIDALTCRHRGTEKGISSVDLEVRAGDFIAITGRIGSGKSTMLKAILGILPASSGRIYWNGAEVASPNDALMVPRCAYIPQEPSLISATLRENIDLGMEADPLLLDAAIDAAQLRDDIEGFDGGLDSQIGPRGIKLSGGQVKRAAAARTFLRNADLILVDDLSSALDVETERRLWDTIFAKMREKSWIVVTHRRATLRQADRVVVLRDGAVEDEGNLDELLSRCEEMQSLWRDTGTGERG